MNTMTTASTVLNTPYSAPPAPAGSPPRRRLVAVAGVLGALALLPLVATLAGQPFYITVATRVMVFALAALGLNLVLGFGAMVSLGHALYLGVGAYAAGILSSHGLNSGWLQLAAGLGVGLVLATVIGAVCLRASGLAFIMLTLAFGQMFYFLAVGLKQYGGDEGLPLVRSDFGVWSLENDLVLYGVVFALLVATLYGFHRLVHARLGMVLRGCKSNERRMRALGFPTLRYQLVAYVLSALVCVVAGFLLANLTRFASPSYMTWGVSGELIVMVVLGGVGTLMGPVVGAATWLVLEQLLTSFHVALPWGLDAIVRDRWLGLFGLMVVAVVLLMRQGLYGSWVAGSNQRSKGTP